MNTLVRSFLDRDVDLDGVRYVVRSPTVREALQILASAKGTLAGEDTQKSVFFDTLKAWLPEPLFATFTERGYPEHRVVAFAFEAVNEGVPEFAKSTPDEDDAEDSEIDPESLDWGTAVADYMSAYKMPLADVLKEPWNGFLLLSKKTDMVHARAALRLLSNNGIPYIKDDRERQEAIDDIIRRAGGYVMTKEERHQQALDKQPAQLAALSRDFNLLRQIDGGNKMGEA